MHNNIPFLNIVNNISVNQTGAFTSALKVLTFVNIGMFSAICRISFKLKLQQMILLILIVYWWAWPSSYVKEKITKLLKIYEVINHILTKHTIQKDTIHPTCIGAQCYSISLVLLLPSSYKSIV